MKITLNEQNLSTHFSGWLDLYHKMYPSSNLDEKVWEKACTFSFETLPLYEDIYQSVLLSEIKANLEENTLLLEDGYIVRIHINASHSSIAIYRPFEDGSWDISSAESLDYALLDIERVNFVKHKLSELPTSELVELWNRASDDLDDFKIYANIYEYIDMVEPDTKHLAQLIIENEITNLDDYIYDDGDYGLESDPKPTWIDTTRLAEWCIDQPLINLNLSLNLNKKQLD